MRKTDSPVKWVNGLPENITISMFMARYQSVVRKWITNIKSNIAKRGWLWQYGYKNRMYGMFYSIYKLVFLWFDKVWWYSINLRNSYWKINLELALRSCIKIITTDMSDLLFMRRSKVSSKFLFIYLFI